MWIFTSFPATDYFQHGIIKLISRLVHFNSNCLVLGLKVIVIGGIGANLLVVSLESSKILSGLAELALLHTLGHVPVNKGSLGVHEVELGVKSLPGLGNGGGVTQHAHGSVNLGHVTLRNVLRRLVADTNLETSGTPVNELDGLLGLDGGHSSLDVLVDNVSSVQQTVSHVLTLSEVALDHLVAGLETSVGDLVNGVGLVVSSRLGDDGSVGDKGEMDSGVGDQVSLELVKIDVKRTVESQRGGHGRHDLGDHSVKVLERRSRNVEVSSAHVVDGLVIHHEGTVGVLQSGVGCEDGVVRLDDGGRDLGGGVDSKLELGLLGEVDGESLEQKSSETGTGSSTERVGEEESLQTVTVVSDSSDSVHDLVNELLSDGVVTSGVVVSGVLLASDELLGVEQVLVLSGSDLINHVGLEIDVDGSGHVLAGTGLGEEGGESLLSGSGLSIGVEVSIGLDAVLQAVKLPARVTNLATGLTDCC